MPTEAEYGSLKRAIQVAEGWDPATRLIAILLVAQSTGGGITYLEIGGQRFAVNSVGLSQLLGIDQQGALGHLDAIEQGGWIRRGGRTVKIVGTLSVVGFVNRRRLLSRSKRADIWTEDLSDVDRLVLLHLAAFVNVTQGDKSNRGLSWVSPDTAAEHLGITTDQVAASRQRLIETGFITEATAYGIQSQAYRVGTKRKSGAKWYPPQ